MTLADLKVDEQAVIKAVLGTEEERHQLQESGFIPGTAIELQAIAPFGGVLAFAVRGTVIALRKSEAELLEI